jgi:radical SAM/Cys-rich protein
MHATLPRLRDTDFPAIERGALDTLQVNLGYRCNQSCLHCHVNAGPRRAEQMSDATVERVLAVLRGGRVRHLDLTGGAPELHPRFRELVEAARGLGLRVTDRCNLTILLEPGQEDLADFLASRGVAVVASLPCYLPENVDGQRGRGVFAKSIEALRRLNALGYGQDGSGLELTLMYNPTGPYLPPAQAALEADYRKRLGERYGVRFTRLAVLTNMPIQRFGSTLISKGQFDEYLNLLKANFRPENLEAVMCRSLVSVDWRGRLYDCDFNQMLGLSVHRKGRPARIEDLLETDFRGRPVVVADHCYGCTAGQGSSCGGALA